MEREGQREKLMVEVEAAERDVCVRESRSCELKSDDEEVLRAFGSRLRVRLSEAEQRRQWKDGQKGGCVDRESV
jgi:hypothetical protein